MTDPFGMVARRCREIDALLDRLENAGRPRITETPRGPVVLPGQIHYTDMKDVLYDVDLFKRFADEVWDQLDHRRQRHYTQRIASIKRERHRHDIVGG